MRRRASSEGGTDVGEWLETGAITSASSSNADDSRSVSQTNGDITVHIQGGGNPDAMTSSFERAAVDNPVYAAAGCADGNPLRPIAFGRMHGLALANAQWR